MAIEGECWLVHTDPETGEETRFKLAWGVDLAADCDLEFEEPLSVVSIEIPVSAGWLVDGEPWVPEVDR